MENRENLKTLTISSLENRAEDSKDEPPHARRGTTAAPSRLMAEAPSPQPTTPNRARSNSIYVHASTRSKTFLKRFFPGVSIAEWNDWHWQVRNRFRTAEVLAGLLRLSAKEQEALTGRGALLPVGVPPYYASLLDPDNPDQALRRTVVPVMAEFEHSPEEARDPLGEDSHSPVPGLVHRYPDRVLFLATVFCSTYCRYCTRARAVGNYADYKFNRNSWERALKYIEEHKRVRDVLISGGDPLDLSDEHLEYLLSRLRAIPHVEFVRLGTKMPAVLPQRITPALTRMLRKYHPLWMSLHFVHPDELTPETAEACCRLSDAGIPLGSQTVLLKGVNDDSAILKRLFHGLLTMRVRPYYLYQCDPIVGSAHFRTTIERGLEIMRELRGYTTGYAVPTYVVDAPGGGGKIPLQSDYVLGRDGRTWHLRNYEGREFSYLDPP